MASRTCFNQSSLYISITPSTTIHVNRTSPRANDAPLIENQKGAVKKSKKRARKGVSKKRCQEDFLELLCDNRPVLHCDDTIAAVIASSTGCHATTTDWDICVCYSNNSSINIVQQACPNQAVANCVSGCP